MAEATSLRLKRGSDGSEYRHRKHCKNVDEDRISSLPDFIRHILSFLPTKYDCILSTKWSYLRTSVTTLDFNDKLRFCNEKPYRRSARSFMNFVDRVLITRGVHSNGEFSLSVARAEYDPSRASAWVCTATMRNVKELSLHISQESKFQLPRSLFKCEELMVLKLSGLISPSSPFFVSFSHLKVLHLHSLRTLDDDAIVKLTCGSPVLEDLVFERDCDDLVKNLHVQSSSLKRLTITLCDDYYYGGDLESITVNAPKLEFLELFYHLPKEFRMIHSSSKVKADIRVGWNWDWCNAMRPSAMPALILKRLGSYFRTAVQFLTQVSKVELLCFSSFLDVQSQGLCTDTVINALVREFSSLEFTTFDNLTRLDLRVSELASSILPAILKCSPKLKVIIFRELGSLNSKCVWDLPEIVPQCLVSQLEVVEFRAFEALEAEMEIAKYFMKNAIVLKRMAISPWIRFPKRESDVLKELSSSPRGSSACQISFC